MNSLFNLYRLPKSTFLGLMVALLTWIWFFLSAQQTKESPRFPLILRLSLYFFFSLLSLTQATNIYEGLFKLLEEITSISLFWISINHLRTKDRMERVLLWIIPCGVIISLIGIYQMFGGDIPGLVRMEETIARLYA